MTMAPPSALSNSAGSAASMAKYTPLSMTLMASRYAVIWCDWSPRIGMIPALAKTKSSRPNSATPLCHHGFEPLEVADVGLLGDDAATGLLDEVHGLVEVLAGGHRIGDAVDLFAEVDGDDVSAFLGESHRMRAALAACRPGDEGDFAIKSIAHVQVSLSLSCGIERQVGWHSRLH